MSVNDDDHEQLEALDTLSLTDFPLIVEDHHRNPPSPATTENLFEFYSGISGGYSEDHRMSHAEDMFSGGKLIPINDQQAAPRKQDQTRDEKHIHRRRCESMHELKSNTNKGNASKLVRNSYSLDYKKLNRKSRFIYEPTNNLSNKTSSSRWSDLVFGPLKGPPEMDLRDIRNRQNVNTSKSLFSTVEGNNRFAVSRVGCDRRKSSWGVLGILSCKSSGSVAVNMPLGYEKLSLKN
ncbi:hypothetical protein L1987_14367 [Smallanthus sonchifolius]|uniref:Uncharacterized protein n=1 Tax=Smallanthus sonchifolius TaxID=185202 RepID=A0ACB9J461_9ASTR|nr:hypothetical protein L1987_14367 [Smallanthus sonchifolius]